MEPVLPVQMDQLLPSPVHVQMEAVQLVVVLPQSVLMDLLSTLLDAQDLALEADQYAAMEHLNHFVLMVNHLEGVSCLHF